MADQANDSIFNENQSTAPATQEPVASSQQEEKTAEASATDPYADLLSGIQTEDGRQKYASIPDAINSIPHAQKHISSLESELSEIRRQLEEARSAKEMLNSENVSPQPDATPRQQVKEDDLVGLVDQVLSQRESKQLAQRNVSTVVENLTSKFGNIEAADKAYRAKASELGISIEMLNELAATSPKAAMAYFGVTGASAPTKTHGSVNTATLSQQPQEPRKANPLLSGSMKDMQAEWNRIKTSLNK